MNALISWLGSEACRNLTMALAHTLWQGLLVASLLYIYLRAVPAEAARRRYTAGVVGLIAIVLGGLLTWSILNYEPASRAPGADGTEGPMLTAQAPSVATPSGVGVAGVSPARTEGILPSSPKSDALATRAQWHVWATGAWLLGTAVMLLRALAVMLGGGRLRRRCVPVEDETLPLLVERLREQMRIGRRIRVGVGEHLAVPGVVGCFWPTLLLPAALVSGVPTDDLRAILAHELAHVKRFDYLVNLAQMLVEALLFFNPAVWWISRQIRIEREACCDLAGVALTGRKTQYAQTLVAWAQTLRGQRVAATAALVGFADGADEGTLLDRVRRIVITGHRPRLRVSWPVAAAMLLLSALALAALWQGTDAAVAFAGNILTPQQRIEAIAEISQEYGYGEYGEEDKVLVSGTVRTYDGGALPKVAELLFYVSQPRQGHSIGASIFPNEEADATAVFSHRLPYGQIYAIAVADGYAPAFAGPYDPKRGGTIEGIEMVLDEGFVAKVRVIDEAGRPIEGAHMIGGYTKPGSGSYSLTTKLTTDANGIVVNEHAAEYPVGMRVTANGYEPERITAVLFKPDETTTITLREARPTTGIVLSKATGDPIASAEVRLLYPSGIRFRQFIQVLIGL